MIVRINKFIARYHGVSRRQADEMIQSKAVIVNGESAVIGQLINDDVDIIKVNGQAVQKNLSHTVLLLNKPVGYICSRNAQSKKAKTVYDILPTKYKNLKTVGRLDKDSSGLILLTDDGDLAHRLTHPKFKKIKIYLVKLDKPLTPLHQQIIADFGINLDDGISKLGLERLDDNRCEWRIAMDEGRNRQIRRTFSALGYRVTKLHRTNFGSYTINELKPGQYQIT